MVITHTEAILIPRTMGIQDIMTRFIIIITTPVMHTARLIMAVAITIPIRQVMIPITAIILPTITAIAILIIIQKLFLRMVQLPGQEHLDRRFPIMPTRIIMM